MRILAAGLLLGGLLALGSCGGGSEGGHAIVRLTTPVSLASSAVAAAGEPTPTNTPVPPPELMLSATEVYQAGAVLVSVIGQVSAGSISFVGRAYPLTKGSQSMYAFVGVDADDAPGVQPLRVDFTLLNGSKGSLSGEVTVLKTVWTVDAVAVPPDQTNLLDPRVAADELEILHRAYSQVTPRKLWSIPWLLPVEGSITTRFGEQRAYNGGPASGHHTGTDIGAAEGTPVKATSGGRVVLARQLQLRGNMVIVDHGGGLFSGYAHLSAFAVAEGQDVAPGEVVGYVGSTGLSTGAHLHWEMSAGGVLVDALRFTDGTNGF
ncbi:MAG: M23 family metallopeptidase [Dehalococcoidia bacterium]|nr:M23 family metallopeptidase [Dehalococcoidia bacterium]